MKELLAKLIVAIFFVGMTVLGLFLCVLLLPAAAILWAMDQIHVERTNFF